MHPHPIRNMGYDTDLRKSSKTPQTSRAVKEKSALTRADRSTRLPNQLKSEKPIRNTVELHHGVKQNRGDTQFLPGKPLGNCQKQFTERKAKDDELVKHMSNLPCYLQREEKVESFQEKVFNFGVLDWTRLENWKYNQKPATCKSTMYSPSTSNTSSPFSTVGSSTLSTRSDSGIHAHWKRSPSQDANLASSSNDNRLEVMKHTNDIRSSHKDRTAIFKNPLGGQEIVPGTRFSNQRHQIKAKFEKGTKNEMNSKFIKEIESSSSSSKSDEVPFSPKGKKKVSEGESTQRTEQIQEPISAGQHCPSGNKTIVLLLPKSVPNKRYPSPSRTSVDSKQSEASRSSFSDGLSIHGGLPYPKIRSEIPYSRSQLSKLEPTKQFNLILPRSLDAVCSKDPVGISHPPRHSTEAHYIRSECLQTETPLSERSRNQSPNRWPSVGKGKITRSLSFKEASHLPQLSSTYVTAKSGPVGIDSYSNTSSREKMATSTRSRSSPLRRLLDPLLKSRTANCLPSAFALHEEAHKVRKSSDASVRAPVETQTRISNVSNSTLVDTNNAHQDEKHEVSMVQALLQIQIRQHNAISDPIFVKSHLKYQSQFPGTISIDLAKPATLWYKDKTVYLKTYLSDIFKEEEQIRHCVLTSCNGLAVVAALAKRTYYVLNPVTRQYMKLPPPPEALWYFLLVLDDTLNQYKLFGWNKKNVCKTVYGEPSWREFITPGRGVYLTWVLSPAVLNKWVCWKILFYERVLALNTENWQFRQLELPQQVHGNLAVQTA